MDKRFAKSLTWGKRLTLVVLVLVGLIYLFLSIAERMKEPARLGIQDYLSQLTGHTAEITDLELFELAPDMMFRFHGIDIRDKANHKKVLVHADKFFIAMPAWRMYLGMRAYLGLEVRGLEFATGYLTPKKIDISFAGISDPAPEESKAQFLAEGTYNNQSLLLTAEMQRKVAGKHYIYSFSGTFPFTFKLGSIEASGLFERGMSDVTFKQVQVVRGADRMEFVLKNVKNDPLHGVAAGSINGVEFNGELKKSGDDTLFVLTPVNATDGQSREIEAFLAKLRGDLGLDETSAFHLELAGAHPDNTSTTQETDQE